MTRSVPKVAILAGGFGTRLSEETSVRPKPMVEIGGNPLLWHLMKIYSHYGMNDFVIIGGYKVEVIRDYIYNFRQRYSDFTIDLGTGEVEFASRSGEAWRVTVIDAGDKTMTGGRIKRAQHLLDGDTFCLTYGDGLSDVPIDALLQSHREQGGCCTLTAVTQPGRYGALRIGTDGSVNGFREKGELDGGLVNGGYFICEPEVFDFIDGDETVWEEEPMARMIHLGKLRSFHHQGYWQSMDSLRDKNILEEEWENGAAWRVWQDVTGRQ